LLPLSKKHLEISKEDQIRYKKELDEQGIVWVNYGYSKFGVIALVRGFLY